MRILFPRYRVGYTLGAIAVLLLIVAPATVGIQLFTESIGSRTVHILQAITVTAAFFVLDPLRSLLYRIVERAAHPKPILHGEVRDQLEQLFIEQGDLYSACRRASLILESGFHVDDAVLHLRYRGQFYRIGDETETLVGEDPLLEYLQESPGAIAELYDTGDEVNGGLPSPQVVSYMRAHRILYVLPLVIEGSLFGYLTMHQQDARYRLLEQDRFFLKSIGGLLAVSFRRLRMERHLQQRIEELQAVNRISHTMNSSLNVKETLESVMDVLMEMTTCDRALMYLRDEDGEYFIPTMSRGVSEEIDLDFTVRTSESIFRHVVESREPMVVTDAATDDRVNKEYAEQVRTKSFVVVPMVTKEDVIGIIGVDNLHSGREVAQIQVDLLMTLANHAAIALENSRLYERTERFNEELQERIREATADLEQIVDMKSHFITVASHQLRTPSTVVRGLLSMLQEDPEMSGEERQRYVDQAFHSMTRLERIVSDLLSATELEGKELQPLMEEVAIVEVPEKVVSELDAQARERGLALSLRSHVDSGARMRTDAHRLREVLSNLVDNAIRYTQDGGVTVEVRLEDGWVLFDVHDTGVGLSQEDSKIIFEKFQRGRQVREIAPDGSGLGLYIVRRLVEALGGTVEAISEGVGHGATFRLRIPQDHDPR